MFHDCSPRSVSRFVATLRQQIHGGQPLLMLILWRSPLNFLIMTCNELLLMLSVCCLAGTCYVASMQIFGIPTGPEKSLNSFFDISGPEKS